MSADQFTPTTEYVREFYAKFHANLELQPDYEDEVYDRAEVEFDRWLAARDAETRRRAVKGLLTPAPDDLRMDAYYYGFEDTGVGIIDRILSEVAIAGKGLHSTEGWADEDYLREGLTFEQRIQKAANDAADRIRALAEKGTDQ